MKYINAVLISVVFLWGCQTNDQLNEKIENSIRFDLSNAQQTQLIEDPGFQIGSGETVNSIGAIAVDESGKVFLINKHRKRIEVYEGSGERITKMGGVGNDPGDFQNPVYLKVIGGQLYVYDQSLLRAYAYDTASYELQSATDLSQLSGKLKADSLHDTQPNKFLVSNEGTFLVGFQKVESPKKRQLFFYRIDKEGKVISDQLLSFDNKSLHVDDVVDPPLIMMLPYEPETLIRVDSKNNIYTAFTENFLISVQDSTGQKIASRYYPFERHDLIRSDAIDLYQDTFQRRAIRRASLPEKWPAISKMLIDDEDRIWVATIVSDLNDFRWFVLNSNGQPITTFELPRSEEIQLIKDDFIYVKEYNPNTYSDQVKRYRFQP